MNALFFLTSIFFFIWVFRNILFWVSLWQLKEYRFDRLFAHFRETVKGKSILFSKLLLLKWLIIISYIFFAIKESYIGFYTGLVFLIFAYEAYRTIREAERHTLKRPVPTAKAILLLVGMSAIMLILYYSPLVSEKYLWLMLIERFVPILSAILVTFLAFPTEFLQTITIEKAIRKIRSHENLLVIGISGSYGKSSTKDYIAQVLSEKFSVLKTEGSHNTPIGIANAIIKGLKENTSIFVVELGSYKRGEIAELCNIVHPKIGVTTSISDQHLSLFGSFQNIFETEKELIDSLPKDGLALFNGQNVNAYKLYKQTTIKKVLYFCQDNALFKKTTLRRKNSPDIVAHDLKMQKKSVAFTVIVNATHYRFEAPLLGLHAVENILPTIYLGLQLGMKYKDIKYAVARLKPLPKRMIRYELLSGATMIDDTFNASPESIYAALTYMQIYKGKKVLILEPMIELGKNAKQNHYDLGKQIAKVCDYLFLTNKNFYKSITQGIRDSGNMCEVEVAEIKDIVEFLNKNVGRDDIVVFEGREGAAALHKIV